MSFTVTTRSSRLHAGQDGLLKLHLVQAMAGHDFHGRRNEREGAEGPFSSADYAKPCRAFLGKTTPDALNVISFHNGMTACEPELIELSRSRTIVTLAGIDTVARNGEGLTNDTFIAQDGQLIRQAKLSLASEDQQQGVERGREFQLFKPDGQDEAISWAVLNCHDYTHVALIAELLRHKVELLVVVAYNTATRLYWEYAISDIHRLFCYVVVVNVGELGGSGVFAPFRRIGFQKNAQIGAAGQLFETRGTSEIAAKIELDIRELRRLRRTFADNGFHADAVAREDVRRITAMVPSEHFMQTHDRAAGPPPVACIEDVATRWRSERIRIAIAQLDSMSMTEYVSTQYRIRNHGNCSDFLKRLDSHLRDLKTRCKLKNKTPNGTNLDVLLLPEVFVPRTYLGKLKSLGKELGATIICGVDYPDGGEESNANECMILRPDDEPVTYRKITRSQYDAWRTMETPIDRMPLMPRGDTMYRFVNRQGQGFGVLVCYDFSHFDLIHSINLDGRNEPLDVLFVVAHNPFGLLYRSCCVADAHRFYQYIVMCNVSTYGGSGVFGPERTPGARHTIVEVGKGTEAIALAELDLAGLHEARRKDDHRLHEGKFVRLPGLFQDAGRVPKTLV